MVLARSGLPKTFGMYARPKVRHRTLKIRDMKIIAIRALKQITL
jgi:hypothetical protein